MAARSADRETVARQWTEAVSVYEKMDTADQCAAGKEALKPGMTFINALAVQLLLAAMEVLNVLSNLSPGSLSGRAWLFWFLTAAAALGTVFFGGRILRFLTPQRYFGAIGKRMLSVLRETGEITSECMVKTEEEDGYLFAAWLKGGTDREKTVFADALSQMLSPVDNQRYLLCQGGADSRGISIVCRSFFPARRRRRRPSGGEWSPVLENTASSIPGTRRAEKFC